MNINQICFNNKLINMKLKNNKNKEQKKIKKLEYNRIKKIVKYNFNKKQFWHSRKKKQKYFRKNYRLGKINTMIYNKKI